MKKRMASALLALLMILSVVSANVAFAADGDEGIMPLLDGCPHCLNGTLRRVALRSHEEYQGEGICPACKKIPAEDRIYRCKKYMVKTTYQMVCDNCGDGFQTYTDNGRVIWKHG